MKIFESNKSLNIYKKLIAVLGEYSTNFPATGVSKLFNQATENGKRILPTDKLALNILWSILAKESSGAAIHKLLNIRFSNLPIELQPLVPDGRSKEVAFCHPSKDKTNLVYKVFLSVLLQSCNYHKRKKLSLSYY